MNSQNAQKLIAEIAKIVAKNGIDTESLLPKLKELREQAKLEQDPLMTRSVRMAYEHIENNEGWEYATIKAEEDEEGNPLDDESYTAEEHFAYLVSLWEKSDNKYNRDEIRSIANELNEF